MSPGLTRLTPLFFLGVLAGCPKSAPTEAPGPVGPPPPPEGFTRVAPPDDFNSVRPLSSVVLPDGTLAIAGSAVRAVQYQWMLRVPQTGEPQHVVLDPGRVEWLGHNGTAGFDAVGVLGGVPVDKAWYGEIDAFGTLRARQTYLSEGNGQLHARTRVDAGLVLAGESANAEQQLQGWFVRTDNNGRDTSSTAVGDASAQGLGWLGEQGGIVVGAGWQLDTTEDPWVVAIDGTDQVVLDHRWQDAGWTRLNSGTFLPDGDLLVTGYSAPTRDGALDGAGSLFASRIGPEGSERWAITERSDLSQLTRAVRWGGGLAVAGLTGAYGTRRQVVVGLIDDDGTTRWSQPKVPAGMDFAELHSVDDRLWLVAAGVDEHGIHFKKVLLEGSVAQ